MLSLENLKLSAEKVSQLSQSFATFEQWQFNSTDNLRQYLITILIPIKKTITTTLPVCFFLDGNAVIKHILANPQYFANFNCAMVTIGYYGTQEFFVANRSFDYTPNVNTPLPTMAEITRSIKGGGGDIFLDLIEKKVINKVIQSYNIDHNRLTLWGHSLGGVLALYTLFTRPKLFNNYLAADPSLWWNNGYLTKLPKQPCPLKELSNSSKKLTLIVGESANIIAQAKPRTLRPGITPELAEKIRLERSCISANAASVLANDLNDIPNLTVTYQYLANVMHGPLLEKSLPYALQLASS